MPIELADGFSGRLLKYCDQACLVLREAQPRDLAFDAMRAARDRLWEVPHPDEPEDPFISNASEITVGPDGPTFTIDAADAGYGDVLNQLVSALLAGLSEAGLASGTLDCLLAGA